MCEAYLPRTEREVHEALQEKAHLHHYLQVDGMEEGCFTEAVSSLSALIEEYDRLDATKGMPVQNLPRLSIAV